MTPCSPWALSLLTVIFFPLFLLSCGGGGGGGGGSSAAPPSAATNAAVSLPLTNTNNQIPVVVEQNPAISSVTLNLPYVTVTVCNKSSTCLSIDHVIVDTGSYGLRVLASFPGLSGLGLAPVTYGGLRVGECSQFIDGFMWGGVYSATVKLAGEVATSIPIQLISDPNLPNIPSTSCTSTGGPNNGTLSGIEGNGLLGVGLLAQDPSPYYTCTTGSGSFCTPAPTPPTFPITSEVTNPVAAFGTDNNGVILQMPAVGIHGQSSATGVLTFGIDNNADNQLSGSSIIPTSSNTYFSASITGQTGTYPTSFFDSGSNFYFISPLSGISTNSSGNYNPSTYTSLTGTATSLTTPSSTAPLSFGLFDITADLNANNLAFNDNGSTTTSGTADFGMPYYYGHSIGFVLSGQTVSEGAGPLYAIK